MGWVNKKHPACLGRLIRDAQYATSPPATTFSRAIFGICSGPPAASERGRTGSPTRHRKPKKRASTRGATSSRRARRQLAFLAFVLWRRSYAPGVSDARRLEFLCVIRRVFELDALELPVPFENLSVIFDKPQGAVELDVRSRSLQEPFVFEPFNVGKVA